MRLLQVLILLHVFLLISIDGTVAADLSDNGDGTVTDHNTGLIWQHGEGESKNWESALIYCESLSLASKSDWRLPNHKELQSLIDYTKTHPALDKTHFPNVNSSYYWSSTNYSGNTTYAWGVLFYYGYVGINSKSSNYYVRCARGGK